MPIYEYRCRSCGKRVSIITLRVGEEVRPRCEHCGGRRLSRLMSRFATLKSDEARLEAMADPTRLSGLDENDPKSMARWMRRMGKEMGEEFAGDDFDEMVEEMESGAVSEEDDGEGEDDLGDDGD
jgi:putative FmdB family regulatory protein